MIGMLSGVVVRRIGMLPAYADPVTRDGAREEAKRELAKDLYRTRAPGLLRRILQWFVDRLNDLASVHPTGHSGPNLAWLLLLAVVVVVVGVVLVRYGPLSRTARSEEEFDLGTEESSSDDHRTLADRFAQEERYAEAVRERLRAIVRDLDGRGIVEARAGRTVAEIVALASARLPGAAKDLAAGGRLFSDVWYGGRPATPDDDAEMREIEHRVSVARPATAGAAVGSSGWALPGGGEGA
jgi:hypothetical protein